MRQILLQQYALRIHMLKYLPKWYLQLQLMPHLLFVCVSTAVAALVALAAYFNSTLFARANRAPILPREDRNLLKALECRAHDGGRH